MALRRTCRRCGDTAIVAFTSRCRKCDTPYGPLAFGMDTPINQTSTIAPAWPELDERAAIAASKARIREGINR